MVSSHADATNKRRLAIIAYRILLFSAVVTLFADMVMYGAHVHQKAMSGWLAVLGIASMSWLVLCVGEASAARHRTAVVRLLIVSIAINYLWAAEGWLFTINQAWLVLDTLQILAVLYLRYARTTYTQSVTRMDDLSNTE